MREAILGLIAGIACVLALLALQYAGMARKSRDTYKERYDSVKGLLCYVPDEQWETYVNQRLKKLNNERYNPNDGDNQRAERRPRDASDNRNDGHLYPAPHERRIFHFVWNICEPILVFWRRVVSPI
jgi:hypothetical protein